MVWDKVFFIGFTLIGLGIGAWVIFQGWMTVQNPPLCLVFEENFSSGTIDPRNWSFETELGGFGAQSFDWTTNDTSNAYVDDAGLHIVPTLTIDTTDITAAQLMNGYTVNLTATGTCSGTTAADCVAVSNLTTGTMINPVRSARLITRGLHSITYGRIEVVAKLPRGDWLWPAIWMMPENSVYGSWPKSGEIDIMESKGNPPSYDGGRNTVGGTLHWGPTSSLDAFWRTMGVWYMKRGSFAEGFHTFGVQWTPSAIFTYVDTPLAQSLYVPFGNKYGDMYSRGQFGSMSINGSIPVDPWAGTNAPNAPFDQPFYLILNVAVGSSSGYFANGYGNKPWVDGSKDAMEQFWNAKDAWYPTWGAGDSKGMTVKSVKMWNLGKCQSG